LKIQNGGGRHLEKSQKTRYLCNGLTDLYEVRYADAKMCHLTAQTIKNFEFHESKMADGRHFENS